MNEKQMIKQIADGKNLEESLPRYSNELATLYYEYSLARLSMEYYTLYEIVSEQEHNHFNVVKEPFDAIQDIINQSFFQIIDGKNREALLCKVDGLRSDVIKKMKILTSYADQLEIFEYILNRKEATFYEITQDDNQEDFIQKVIEFIFASKDNFIVNENIKQVIGQLPVRMAKTKYYELIKDSFSLYKTSEQSSLDTYIYMLKSSAMLFHLEGMEESFPQLEQVVRKLKNTDFMQLEKETFDERKKDIIDASSLLIELTDHYMAFQTIINNLYVHLLTNPFEMSAESEDVNRNKEIVRDIYIQFCEATQIPLRSTIVEKMVLMEGYQEDVYAKYIGLELILNEIKYNHMSLVEAIMLRPIFEALFLSEKLLSCSIFIELDKEETSELVDQNYLEKVTAEFIKELISLFETSQQCVKRAIIANTINKMPVFFSSKQDVIDYINQSLQGCRDLAEKKVSMQVIRDLMKE